MTTKPTSKQVSHNGVLLHDVLTSLEGASAVTSGAIVSALGYVPVNPAGANLTGVPTAPTAVANTSTAQVATTAFVSGALAAIPTATALAASLASQGDPLAGSALVGHRNRTLRSKLDDQISLTDFGAKGDNNPASAGLNDIAISAAIVYMQSSGFSVFVPQGVYHCNPFTLYFSSYAQQASFFGIDRDRTVFKRLAPALTPFVTIGAAAGNLFQAGIQLAGLGFDGGAAGVSGDTVRMYDVVRSSITDCAFLGGEATCRLYGGISVHFTNCLFSSGNYGLYCEKFTSAAGGGWSNLITVTGGEVVLNNYWGVWYDHGSVMTLRSVDVEGNGTVAGSNLSGGVYVGPNVGSETLANNSLTRVGLSMHECWLEANRGVADILVSNGTTNISSCLFYSDQTTHDIRIDGGRYTVEGCASGFPKAQNFLEGAFTLVGNLLSTCSFPTVSYSSVRTTAILGNRVYANGGEVVSSSLSKPLLQAALDSSPSGTDIFFPQTYTAPPFIALTPVSNSTLAQTPKLEFVGNDRFRRRVRHYYHPAL